MGTNVSDGTAPITREVFQGEIDGDQVRLTGKLEVDNDRRVLARRRGLAGAEGISSGRETVRVGFWCALPGTDIDVMYGEDRTNDETWEPSDEAEYRTLEWVLDRDAKAIWVWDSEESIEVTVTGPTATTIRPVSQMGALTLRGKVA